MFYHFDQNNSGGRFHFNEKLSHHVIIEAGSAAEANRIAEDLGIYFDGVENDQDCACCGDRWHQVWGQGDDEPLLYAEHPASYQEYFVQPGDVYCRVFYSDGRVAEHRVPAPAQLEEK